MPHAYNHIKREQNISGERKNEREREKIRNKEQSKKIYEISLEEK